MWTEIGFTADEDFMAAVRAYSISVPLKNPVRGNSCGLIIAPERLADWYVTTYVRPVYVNTLIDTRGHESARVVYHVHACEQRRYEFNVSAIRSIRRQGCSTKIRVLVNDAFSSFRTIHTRTLRISRPNNARGRVTGVRRETKIADAVLRSDDYSSSRNVGD